MSLVNNKSLLIFDLDDTLFDYKKTEESALIRTCDFFGIKSDVEIYQTFRKSNDMAKQTVHDFINNIEVFRNTRVAIFFDFCGVRDISPSLFVERMLLESEHGELISGVYETLLKLPYRMVVGTNGTTYPRINKLNNSIISKFFSGFYSSESLGCAKPNPEFIWKICEYEKIDVKEAVYIGDRLEVDGLCAVSSGATAIIVSDKTPKNFDANVVCLDCFSNLIEVL